MLLDPRRELRESIKCQLLHIAHRCAAQRQVDLLHACTTQSTGFIFTREHVCIADYLQQHEDSFFF